MAFLVTGCYILVCISSRRRWGCIFFLSKASSSFSSYIPSHNVSSCHMPLQTFYTCHLPSYVSSCHMLFHIFFYNTHLLESFLYFTPPTTSSFSVSTSPCISFCFHLTPSPHLSPQGLASSDLRVPPPTL